MKARTTGGATPARPRELACSAYRVGRAIRRALTLFSAALLLVAGPRDLDAQDRPDVSGTLERFARAFTTKVPEHPSFSLELEVRPLGRWHVLFDGAGSFQAGEGPTSRPSFRFDTSASFFQRLASGEIVGMTAMAQATPSDPTPLGMVLGPEAEDLEGERALFLQLAMHFFNPEVPGRVDLDAAEARTVHGAAAVGLFYHEGFRSAWYRVDPGQRLNEPGDTNPFPQAFIILRGRGTITIGARTVSIRGGEAYYIPPESDHIVTAEEGSFVELLFLAWGEGA